MTRKILTPVQGAIINSQNVWGPGGTSGVGATDGGVLWGGTGAPPRAAPKAVEIEQYGVAPEYGWVMLTYTPPVDCWWRVWSNVYVYKADAAYHYLHIYLSLSPADVDGASVVNHLGTQHNSVVPHSYRNPSRIWKLAAGVSYTCQVKYNMNAGSWIFYTAYLQTWLAAIAYAR